MIKRIIFDLDNTLIKWEKHYDESIVRAYKKFNIELTQELLDEFNVILRKYESTYNTFNMDVMFSFYNEHYKLGMPDNFINEWMQELSYAIPSEDKKLEETLKYLSSKYKLVVLTNWYTCSQSARLERLGILKYFDKVIGADQVVMKPDKEAFIYAKELDEFNECVMIGDNIKIDLETPEKLGMRTILITDEPVEYKEKITKIIELKEML